MAKSPKQKQEKISKHSNSTQTSSVIRRAPVSDCNQLDIPLTLQSLFNVWFSINTFAEDHTSFINPDNTLSENINIYAAEAMEKHEGNEKKNEPVFESGASVEGPVNVPAELGSVFPDTWYETSNKEFLSCCAAPESQLQFQNASQVASYQQMTSAKCSQFADEQIGFSEQISSASPLMKQFSTDLICTNRNTSHLALDSQHASTSGHIIQSKKRRPSESKSSNLFDDSDSDVSDDESLSDAEEASASLHKFAEKFLELRLHGRSCNFWQYNSQSRGPKGKRIYGEIALKDCHILDEFTDPVIHNDGSSDNRHATKLRHGEGNDPRPNTKKLLDIGAHILRLEDEFQALTESKTLCKEEVNREKNKLASRICRLKKKAQHEANKVKLEGLREEHQQLVAVIARLMVIMERYFVTEGRMKPSSDSVSSDTSLSLKLENLIKSHLKFMIAGHTSEYVNTQIEKAARCCSSNRQLT